MFISKSKSEWQIFEFLKDKVDCPSLHDDGWMPILDIKARVESGKIIYQFYEKALSNDREGDTGFNAHARIDTHEKQIRFSVQTNSMARHLTKEHPARRRDPTTFSFRVERAGERPLPRKICEAQKIGNEASGRLINGRNEHIPPAIRPLTPGQ